MRFIYTKKCLLCFITVLFCKLVFAQPVIQSFSPAAGSIGTLVIIKGSGFSSNVSGNIVYFGAVKAMVAAATPTSIQVRVPYGASYEPVTVTANNLTAYANEPFVVTFPGAAPTFTKDVFQGKTDVNIAYENPDEPYTGYDFCVVDMDDDGKPEMVSANAASNSISVVQNKCVIATISFDKSKDYSSGELAMFIDHGDFDGDGKQDIAVVNSRSKTVSVFKNNSTAGNIALASKIDIPIDEKSSWDVAIGDLDGDGKPDMVVSNENSFNISIYINTSTGGNISFAPKVNFKTGPGASNLYIRDVDGDGKQDIINGLWTWNKIVVLRNTSTPGNITFDPPAEFDGGKGPNSLAVGDLDGDGKVDIAIAANQSASFGILRNTSTPGVVSFAEKQLTYIESLVQCVGLGDIDGDGKPDLAVSSNIIEFGGRAVSIFKNISTAGDIEFGNEVDYETTGAPQGVAIADVDGDGKPEMEVIGGDEGVITVFTRCGAVKIDKQPADTATCINGSVSFTISTPDAVNYQWQVNTGSDWNDLDNDKTYKGANAGTLQISVAASTMNNYQYRCVLLNKCGNTFSAPAKLVVNLPSLPAITIATSAATVCKGAAVQFTASVINGGSKPVYQWQKNGAVAGSNAAIYTDNNLQNGDIINCVLTSNATCITTSTAASNNLVMNVTDAIVPTVSIASSANNICFGTPVAFNAAITDGGAAPLYQWTKNGRSAGADSSAYIDSVLNDGDVIQCTLTSGLQCVAGKVESNKITMTINPLVTPAISISPSQNNICSGAMVEFTATTTNAAISPSFTWQKNGVNTGSNAAVYKDNAITEGDEISCTLTLSAAGKCLTAYALASNTVTMHLLQNLPGKVNLGTDKMLCSGSSITLDATSAYASYRWQNNATGSTFIATEPGTYSIEATNACGTTSLDTVLVLPAEPPSHFLPADSSLCAFEELVLKPAKNYLLYLWGNNATTTSITVKTPGMYWLQVTDEHNCIGADTIYIAPKNCFTGVYVPSAFTPNGDGNNDVFKPFVAGNVQQYDLRVFNRFGEMIFQSKTTGKGWDGKTNGVVQTTGVYVWMCIYQLEGESIRKKTGTVTLLK